jgi:hypothetical protein
VVSAPVEKIAGVTRIDGLHVCSACEGSLAEPVAWSRIAGDHWWFALRCPECGSERDVVAERHAVEAFERHVEAAREALGEQARRWVESQMRDWATGFTSALRAEAVYPMDF